MTTQQQTHLGTFLNYRWRNNDEDNPYVIAQLEDGTIVQGPVQQCEFLPGITYEFYAAGRNTGWIENHHGRSFKFTIYAIKVPHSKHGVVAYLQRYGRWIGPRIASLIYDRFGPDSVKMVRTEPERIVAVPEIGRHFTLERARECAAILEAHAVMEDTKIGLTNLFANRGFPTSLVEMCVEKWGVLAPQRIQRDPFTLLVHRMPGCGFARCDRLYGDLGLPAARLKRQMICAWHSVDADSSGNTWILKKHVVDRVRQLVGTGRLRPERAIEMGIRSRWIAGRHDHVGVAWLAEFERARSEQFVAEQLKALMTWETADTTELQTLVAVAGGCGEQEPPAEHGAKPAGVKSTDTR